MEALKGQILLIANVHTEKEEGEGEPQLTSAFV
jgi:hypothetical protein